MTLDEMKAKFTGKHVQYRGMTGKTMDGPIGKVWRVTSRGIWVTLPSGERQQWHAEDCYITRPAR